MRKTPLGVKAISALYLLGAVYTAFIGIMMLVGGNIASIFLSTYYPQYAGVAATGTAFFTTMGIVSIIVALFGAFLAVSLWKMVNVTRMIVLVLSLLGLIGGIISFFPYGWTWVIINAVIIWYLQFNKKVADQFY